MNQYDMHFLMYDTPNIDVAIASYITKTGKKPSLCVVRPDYQVIGDSPILLRSRFGPASAMLLTHEGTAEDWHDVASQQNIIIDKPQKPERTRSHEVVSNKPAGRPKRGGGVCPHCKQRISDFNSLGTWYGWKDRITPPYWEELREFVFRRDDHTCKRCLSKRPSSKLNAHHIIPKEEGGTDGARNLLTLCVDCHEDLKPIMPEPQE